MNNKNGATTIDDEAALRNHITSWIDELKDSTAANNDSRRLDSDPHCVAVKDSAANILASAMEGCGTAASGSLAGGIATNESPNPTCLLLLCEAHFKAADIVTTECETEGIPRDQILACQLTPGYLPPDDPIANADGATILVNTGAFVDVLDNDEGTFGFNLELRDIVTPANDGLCWLGEILGTGKMGVLYTPNEGFIGQDECVYQVCYAEGTRYADQCDDATVTIDVNAQPTSVRKNITIAYPLCLSWPLTTHLSTFLTTTTIQSQSPTAAPTFGCDITLELEPHIPLVSQETCEGKLTELTLKYNGGDCTQSNNEQNGKFECEDSNGGPNTEDAVSITVTDKNGVLKLGDGSLAVDVDVSVGDILTLEPPEDETQFESEINIVVKSSQEEIAPANDDKGTGDDVDPDLLQELTIHTSCSQDLRLLDIFGSTQVFAYTDTKKDAPVTVVQPVTVSGGLVNNNGLDIRSTLFELNEEAIDDVPDPIDGDGFSFEETMMTDLSQESLEYTLDFEGTLVELPGQVCDETIDETFTNRNLGLSLTELAASVPDLSILVSLLELTGLDEVLDGPGSFTAFGK